MGYYVETLQTEFHLPAKNFDAAYKALCELNSDEHENQKTGGQMMQDKKPENSTSISSNPNKWYAWMDWNYDETCPDLVTILTELGFTVDTDDTGIFHLIYDYNKTGAEETFLEALAPYVTPGSFIVWRGEEGETWVDAFDGKTMKSKSIDVMATIRDLLAS